MIASLTRIMHPVFLLPALRSATSKYSPQEISAVAYPSFSGLSKLLQGKPTAPGKYIRFSPSRSAHSISDFFKTCSRQVQELERGKLPGSFPPPLCFAKITGGSKALQGD